MQIEKVKSARWIQKSRVLAMGAIVAAGIGGARLWAQSTQSPQSAEEAAKTFVLLMNANAVSRELQADQLIDDNRLQGLDAALQNRLASRLYRFAQFNTLGTRTLLSNDRQRANVTVENIARPKPLPPVACVQGATGWKVDLLETARNWLGSNDPLIKQIDAELAQPKMPNAPVAQIPPAVNAPITNVPVGVPEATIARDVALAADDPRAQELCQSRLRTMATAMRLYTQDYERLPVADKWNDVLKPYLQNADVFNCPVLGADGYGYAMNWKLSRRTANEVQSPANTVVLYETNVPRPNAAYDGRDLMFRHQTPPGARANFAYLDGHVEPHAINEPQNFRLIPQALR